MGKLLLVILIVMAAGTIGSRVASAQDYNHVIKVYAVVAEQRAVYLDESGNIIKIAGNTAKNITPTVFDFNNKQVTITATVQHQYDDFLKSHENHLQAGKTYNVNPLSVNLSPNTEKIDISTANLTFGSLKID